MSKQLKLRRGSTAQHSTFTGAEGEVTVDTTKDTLVVHDGVTAGGIPLATEAAVNAKQAADAELTTLAGMSSSRATYLASTQGFGFRNRIINGDMRIDQRNAGASVTPTSDGTYTLDRWQSRQSQSSKYSIQRNAGSVTPPAGFTNYLGVTSLSSYSAAASDYFGVIQNIEGFNIADLGWGAAGAQTITLSFWVRSSLTGAFPLALTNDGFSRGYVTTYTINAANTWEYKTITIPGDTTGTWLTNSSAGLRLWFTLGFGSNQITTPNAWGSWIGMGVSGGVNFVGTNGATFYITGVQLEAGSVASPFERRDYGRELIMCQRYAFVAAGGSGIAGAAGSTTGVVQRFNLPVSMRAAPTATVNTAGSWGITDDYFSGYTAASFGIGGYSSTTLMGSVSLTGFTSLNTGRYYGGNNSGTGAILFSSEL